MKLEKIMRNDENGSIYVFYRVENKRSINPKAKRKADELIIVGYPKDKVPSDIKQLIEEARKND